MTFAEKLTFLIQLTSASNKQLAEAISVDPSMISRLRGARRNEPKNRAYIKDMAMFFARKCEGNYQRVALSEALGRKHLQMHMETEQLGGVLYDWLTDSREQVSDFLGTFERFSVEDRERVAADPAQQTGAKNSSSSFAYYGNEGRRGAVSAFVAHLLSLDQPGTILLTSDENMSWMFENTAYLTRLQEQMMQLIAKGFRVCRIAAPLESADQAFDSLTRWLPMYMSGQVESFYYPRLRDELYRRTVVALADVAAVVSTSTAGQALCGATVFTQERRLVNAFADEFHNLLSKCRPMMTTYSTQASADALLRCIAQFDSDRGDSIQQSITLSSLTVPDEVIAFAVAEEQPEEAERITRALSGSRDSFRTRLNDYSVIDIHCLASVEDVRAGIVPIGMGYLCRNSPVFYTPELYATHLKSILAYMERYESYHAVLTERSDEVHALFVKENRLALLLRPGTPLTVFEVSQPDIAKACGEYLRRRTATHLSPSVQRQQTVSRLKMMIQELQRA